MPQIEVTFDIDANGIMNVTAKDKATNNEQKITITSSSGLSKDEVDKMARDAEAHAGDDRKKKEEIESRNRADAMVYNIEKMLKEHRSKVAESDAKAVEEALEETKKAMAEGGIDRINQATSKLETASHKLAEAMYKSAGQQAGGQPGGETGGPSGDGHAPGGESKPKEKDNVVDAEFVDVDDKK
jgi:molecular chaperone DnaK